MISLFVDGQADAFLAGPRSHRSFGLEDLALDRQRVQVRPSSQYFCCLLIADREATRSLL